MHCLFGKLLKASKNRSKAVCALTIMARALIAIVLLKPVVFRTAYNTATAEINLTCSFIIVARILIAISLCKMHCLFYISVVFLSSFVIY